MEAIGSMLFISNPISGLATGPQWLPHPWGTIGQFLPVGAAGTALRSVAYFDGRGRLRPGSSCSAGPSAGSSCCRSASGARQRTDGQPGRDERRGIIRAPIHHGWLGARAMSWRACRAPGESGTGESGAGIAQNTAVQEYVSRARGESGAALSCTRFRPSTGRIVAAGTCRNS